MPGRERPSSISASQHAGHGVESVRGVQPVYEEWLLCSILCLGALPGAVPCARLHAKHVLSEWVLDDLAERVELLVSELVTNGVKAARDMPGTPPIGFRLMSDKTRVLIEVQDGNPRPPMPVLMDTSSESGRGLLLVETLSQQWNWYEIRAEEGKVVWAMVELSTS